MTIYELYNQNVKLLPLREKLQLVHWILDEIGEGKSTTTKNLVQAQDSSTLVAYQFDGQTPFEHLAQIAAMPSEGLDDNFSGADHDQVLYSGDDVQ